MKKVGIRIVSGRPRKIPRFDGRRSHCRLVALARKGRSFYAEAEDISCPLARFHLGLQKRTPLFIQKLSENLAAWYGIKKKETARNYLAVSPCLEEGEKYLVYSPYKGKERPDIMILTGRPAEIMAVVRTMVIARKGERLAFRCGGMAATCCESTVIPLLTGEPNLSLGCCGTRSAGELADDHIQLGVPRAYIKYLALK
jgi:uncharacterized protein (DUF169 family)